MKISDIFAYIQGNIRYKFYYGKLNFLLYKHIKQQISFRILVMDKECYNNGSCKICGCKTTALQMADKTCDKPCYPKMMSKKEWKSFIKNKSLMDWRYEINPDTSKSFINLKLFRKDELVSDIIINQNEYKKIWE